MRFVARLFSRATVAFVAAFLFAAAAPTTPPSPPVHSPAASTTAAQAHPALWTVHGSNATIYLLGSIHVLPPKLQWRTPQINAALNAADTFVFEIPMDASQKADIQEFVKENGYLPKGTALPSLLPSEGRKDYTAALT